MSHMTEQALIEQLRLMVGETGVLTGPDVSERFTNTVNPQPLVCQCLVRPHSTQQISQVLALCNREGQAVVPQGGLTGLVQGADATPSEVALSLERMNRIEKVDPVQRVLVAQAGVKLEVAQQAAAAVGLMLPIDLGARGTATLGGLVSTNAGGNRVLRYGMTRDSVLGLEAVLADGTVLTSMNELIKNNSGYDLKHLFIGSEGTLGIVTRVVFRLVEALPGRQMALLALPDFDAVPHLLRLFEQTAPGALTAFEAMWPAFYELVTSPPAISRPPLVHGHALYVMVEVSTDARHGTSVLEQALSDAFEQGWVTDAMLTQTERDCLALWEMRDDVAQMGRFGPPCGYDISVPLQATHTYVTQVSQHIWQRWPDAQIWAFGHLGDGNVHLVVSVPGLTAADHHLLDRMVYDPLGPLGGAVSAEHGIGLEKRAWLTVSRSPAELALMGVLKRSLDPKGTLNPGRVLMDSSLC